MSVCISLYVSAPPVAMLGIAAHVYRVRKCANGTRAKEYHKCLTVNMSTWKGTERRATQWRQSEEVYVLFSGTYPKTLLIQAILFTGFTITTTNSRRDKNSHRKLFLKCEIVVNFIKKKQIFINSLVHEFEEQVKHATFLFFIYYQFGYFQVFKTIQIYD